MTLLGLTFGAPLLLAALAILPAIWWLLRLTPPRPQEEVFPPTAILARLREKEETPAQSPWWLTLLRLLMAALVILALSEPVWNARDRLLSGEGPVLVLLDDGWASAPVFTELAATAEQVVDEAADAERPIVLARLTAEAPAIAPQAPDTVRETLAALQTRPLPANGEAAAAALEGAAFGSVVWLSSGLASAGDEALSAAIAATGATQVIVQGPAAPRTTAVGGVANRPDALVAGLGRLGNAGVPARVTAYDRAGRAVAEAQGVFENGADTGTASFELPVELRNEIARIVVEGEDTAGAVHLLDERFRRRRVGLISGAKADQAQPLLSPLYYIDRALSPFAEVRPADTTNVEEAVETLLKARISTLVLADIGTLPDAASRAVQGFVEGGGLLVRFAGPRLASAEDDTLVPTRLRRGGRSLGGTLTWTTPQPLAAFEEGTPFEGLPVPPDVTVQRQVLAEPDIDLADRTWASLADGTPLVTASRRGAGWIVLFHVTADATWSNLPLSGAFVDMLRRIVAVSSAPSASASATADGTGEAAGRTDETVLPPLSVLDGAGRLVPPGADVRPLAIGDAEPVPTLENPPGLYGTRDAFRAMNLFTQTPQLAPISALPTGAQRMVTERGDAVDLKPWLLAIALALLALDALAVLWMNGALRRLPRAAPAAAIAFALLSTLPFERAVAQEVRPYEYALETRIAYVKTGVRAVDEISRKGLAGLTQFIASRTSLEPAAPVGVDLAQDELAWFPLLYWPIDASAPTPDAKTMARVDAFMKQGGSVLFDTRDQLAGGFGNGATAETLKLREILSALDIPPLEPVPQNHVLTRAFYLLEIFPGRYLDGRLWVETSETEEDDADRPARAGDGVSSILITSNDMAAAWAVEADGAPSLPTVPENPLQRVYAYRAGVNIVMYTLTGNYKSDQVHVPALLERLGQ